ncbi:thioesterase domain-containing protein [Luteibacter aegosomatis]|uniref:YiiD C-terminal domain-containing protein n=1 Tax=Luteibacter aegosomatis TaxID=2911537 RepID=UPI001FF8C3E3|nr:YiiD C-terminal domain-containing protein [Luteibacter aegosomatis]UPG85301.1 thioesterase domain-containing protein [Luteibacter aegosomatis]
MTSSDATLQALERFILDGIPLARAMQVSIAGFDGVHLAMTAPLAPNINDKGCAFGGSLASLMTLAGWALVESMLRGRGHDCDLFVADSTVRYLAPVWGDLRAEARLAPGGDWSPFFATLDARGRARVDVTCVLPGDDGKPAASLEARFVAKRRA